MEAICSYENSVDSQRTARRSIPDDRTLHNHRCENVKSYKFYFSFFLLGLVPATFIVYPFIAQWVMGRIFYDSLFA
jgi:hypothetical protein